MPHWDAVEREETDAIKAIAAREFGRRLGKNRGSYLAIRSYEIVLIIRPYIEPIFTCSENFRRYFYVDPFLF